MELEESGQVVSGYGAKFLRCSGCGNIRPQSDLSWWTTNSCSGMGSIVELEGEEKETAEPEEFKGKLPNFLVFKKKRKVQNEGTANKNRRTKAEATGRVIAERYSMVTSPSWQGESRLAHSRLGAGNSMPRTSSSSVVEVCFVLPVGQRTAGAGKAS